MNKKLFVKIKHLRLQNGLRQEEMATKLNMSQSSHQRMEAGKTRILHYYLCEIAMIFGMSEVELLSDSNGRNVQTSDTSNENLVLSKLVHEKDAIIISQQRLIEEKDKIIQKLMIKLLKKKSTF